MMVIAQLHLRMTSLDFSTHHGEFHVHNTLWCAPADGCLEHSIAEEVSKVHKKAGEDDSLMPLQSSDSPRAGTLHRGSRRPASEDAAQVTSPICKKTDLEDILAHACITAGPAAASHAKGDLSIMETPTVGASLSPTADAAVSLPSHTAAATHEGALKTEAEFSSADNVCTSWASECGSSHADASAQDIDITVAQQVDSPALNMSPTLAREEGVLPTQGNQVSPSKSDCELTRCAAFSLVDGAEDAASIEKPHVCAPMSEEAQAHKLPEAEGTHGTPSRCSTKSPAAAEQTAEAQGQGQAAVADDKANEFQPQEPQRIHGSNAGLRVEVPEARVRCSTPLYGPDSPARILDSLESPLLQATLEEPSPAHISLQAYSDAATIEAVKSPTADSPVCHAARAPQEQDVASPGESSSPSAKANVPALDMDTVGSPVVPLATKNGSDAVSPALRIADDEHDMGTDSPSADTTDASTARQQNGVECRAGAATPEPSPNAERLVSTHSLDEAEFSLLREVMSKPLDPADQVNDHFHIPTSLQIKSTAEHSCMRHTQQCRSMTQTSLCLAGTCASHR